MLIRSQDKTELINLNNATSISVIPKYGGKKGIVVRLIGEDRWTTLGCYSDEKALKVLDEIEKAYCSTMKAYSIDGMIERVTDIPNKIFQMPQEDEV